MINTPHKKIFIQTYGCQMNHRDSQQMLDLMNEKHQMEATLNPDDADLVILNTCSVREKAQEKVFNFLLLKGRKTIFGKAHHFNSISNYTQFSENIPIRTYEEFSTFIDRATTRSKNKN